VKKCLHTCGTVRQLLWLVGTRGLVWSAAACFCLLAVQSAGAGPSPGVASLQADDAQLAAKSQAAVLDLYSIVERLAGAQSRLAALQAQAKALRRQKANLGRELRLARLDTQLSQHRLASRLRFIYEHGTASSLDILMGSSSIDDALTQLDDYDRVSQSDADVLGQVKSASHRLFRLRVELAGRVKDLEATTAAAQSTVSQLTGLRADQASYIAGLESRRSLNAQKIAQITAQAQAAVVRSQALVPAAATLTSTAASESPALPALGTQPVTASGARTLTVSATAYDLQGHTAAGLPVGWGIVAVDPSVIPLGTHMMIPGYGEAVAADTGGAVVGDTIDIWFPTAAQADAWGRRTVTIDLH
jgi:3D (Asp-Asp-Asp) domain-containing protein/septal ring factor EnvC (AmiA/AmiB activator)